MFKLRIVTYKKAKKICGQIFSIKANKKHRCYLNSILLYLDLKEEWILFFILFLKYCKVIFE